MRGAEKRSGGVPKISMDYFFMRQEDEKASKNRMLVMFDEQNGNKYMRAVGKKGLGDGQEMEWLIRDLHEELKSWGYPGSGENVTTLRLMVNLPSAQYEKL